METALDARLIAAYRATHYVLEEAEAGPVVARIDQPCPALSRTMAQQGVCTAAHITASNPASQQLDEASNADRHLALRQAIHQAGWRCSAGHAQDPAGQWPVETGCWIWGLPLAAAQQLAGQFGQNAFVWVDADAIPRLHLLR